MPRLKIRRTGLVVLWGCMRSGKTAEAIRLATRVRIAGQKVLAFKPAADTRSIGLASKGGGRFPAIKVSSPAEILEIVRAKDPDVVVIDEAQLFPYMEEGGGPNLYEVCQELKFERLVIVAGLDMDFKGEPFNLMPYLASIATDVSKFNAVCAVCGEDAYFTQRLVKGEPASVRDPVVIVEGDPCFKDQTYEPRCLRCWKVRRD